MNIALNSRIVAALAALMALLLLIGWIAGFFTPKLDTALLQAPGATLSAPDGVVEIAGQRFGILTLEMQPVVVTETIPATIAARDETVISSRILARISAVNVRAGDTVERGQVLVELEQADLLSRVEQSREQVAAIEAQLTDAGKRLERLTELFSRGLTSRAEVDTARATNDSLKAQLASAREVLAEAEIVLAYSNIRAPIGGRVVERLAEPGDTASPGAPLLSLYDPLSIRAEAHVRERLALDLSIGQTISVQLGSLDETVEGTIEEIVPAADPGSRSFLVKASIDYNASLMPGMFARFVVPVDERVMLLAPRDSIIEVGELNMVRVVDESIVERRYIRLGADFPAGTVVTAGLVPGERVLVPLD